VKEWLTGEAYGVILCSGSDLIQWLSLLKLFPTTLDDVPFCWKSSDNDESRLLGGLAVLLYSEVETQ
jgi:hypothetical protein